MEYKLKIKITKVETNTVHYIVAPNEPVDAAKCFKNILKMKALTQPKSNNNYKFQEDSDDESGNNHWVQVVIYSLDEFLSAREKQSRDMNNYPFCQELLIYDDKDSVRKPIYPIVHISYSDEYWNFMCDDETVKLSYPVPRFFQIMDNSIWNYLVPLPDNDNEPNRFNTLLFDYFNDIYENYQNGLYSNDVAIEYADLSARQARESYLEGDGHATHVVPFIFHSETAIERMIEPECGDTINFIKKDNNCRMRLLLVDDNAMNKDPKKDKSAIIERLLKNKIDLNENQIHVCMKGESIPNEKNESLIILIECVKTLKEAEAAMKEKKYDIVLLDYLLDSEGIKRNYGYELLESICKGKTLEDQINNIMIKISKGEDYSTLINSHASKPLKHFIEKMSLNLPGAQKDPKELLEDARKALPEFKLGPRRKQFFIFISAYTTAVNERLLAQGLNRSERFWFIDTGACPTNTPQLFSYNLLQLMDKRLNDSGITRLSDDNILEFIIRIFIPKKDSPDNKSVRERARDNYHYLLSRHYHFHEMLDDVDVPSDHDNNPGSLFNITGSVLVTNFMLNHINIGGLLEHLIQLVHLTAFGTIRQWAEMWEEYIYIRAYFEKSGLNANNHNDFKLACEYIEKYIYDLKRQQR